MDSQKQIGVQRAGACHTFAQRDILVGTAGQRDPKTARCDQLTRHVLRRRIDDVLFIDAVRADRSGVDPAVTGIEDDHRPIAQWRLPSQRRLSSPRRLRRSRVEPRTDCGAARQQTQHVAPRARDIPHAPPPAARSRPQTRAANSFILCCRSTDEVGILGVVAPKGTYQAAKKTDALGFGRRRPGRAARVVAAAARRCSNTKVGKFRRIFNVETAAG